MAARRPTRGVTPSLKAREIERDNRAQSRIFETPVHSPAGSVAVSELGPPTTLAGVRTLKLNLPKEPIPKLVFSNLLRRAQSNSNLSPTPTPISRPGPGLFDISDADQAALVAQARAAIALLYSHFVEDFGEEEEEATESLDEDKDVVNRYTEARGGGKRGRGVTLDSVDNEVPVLPPPSAQAQRPMNKRRKPTQTKAQKANSQLPLRLSSPVVEIFDIAQVDCELGVQVLVNGKSLFARSHSAVDLILNNLVMAFQVEVEQGPFSGPL